jgi:hypothetical protein
VDKRRCRSQLWQENQPRNSESHWLLRKWRPNFEAAPGASQTLQNAALQRRSLEITERLFKSGHEPELDVQQARSLYLGTLATIPLLGAKPPIQGFSILVSPWDTPSD